MSSDKEPDFLKLRFNVVQGNFSGRASLALAASEAATNVPQRRKADGQTILESEAGAHVLKLMRANLAHPRERQMVSVIHHDFRMMSFSETDFGVGLEFATDKGWITRSGLMMELTEAGHTAVV